jgi:hypothetical protein
VILTIRYELDMTMQSYQHPTVVRVCLDLL